MDKEPILIPNSKGNKSISKITVDTKKLIHTTKSMQPNSAKHSKKPLFNNAPNYGLMQYVNI